MAGQSIADFFLSLGVKVDKSELKKVDNLLKDIEKRLGGVAKAQGEEAKATDKATTATKKKTKAKTDEQKAEDALTKSAKEANKVNAHQIRLRNRWLKQQDKIAATAKEVHDHQMKLMKKAQQASNANTKQEIRNIQSVAKAVAKNGGAWQKQFKASVAGMIAPTTGARTKKDMQKMYDNLFGATAKGTPFKSLNAKQIGANQRAFFANTRGIEIRTGYNAQYRLGEQRAANLAKQAAERVAAEQEANKKIEQERKEHLAKLKRAEDIAAMQKRANERVYGRREAQRELQENAHRLWLERQRIKEEAYAARAANGRSRSSYSRANYLHAGGSVAAFARYGAASLPFIGGAYGMSTLNQANQNLMSTEIANAAIFGERGDQAKNWLKQHANYVGYSYIDTAPIFSSFMASSMPLMGYDRSQELFGALTEFGRTRGSDSVGMKRAMTSLQQMASKGQVMSEELKGQLSEARGFGESRAIFAEAWQMATGGKKTGADAAAQLLEDMQNGKVKFDTIAPFLTQLYKTRAAGGIELARTSSMAEQARAGNAATEMLGAFSQSGGEAGFARLWSGLNSQLSNSVPLANGLGRAFEFSSRQVQKLFAWTESFSNALQGKDSQVADWLGTEGTAQMRADWTEIKRLIDDISNSSGPSWLAPMETLTRRIKEAMGFISRASTWKSETGSALSSAFREQGFVGAGSLAVQQGVAALGSGLGRLGQTVLESHPTASMLPGYETFYGTLGKLQTFDPAASYWADRGKRMGFDSMSMAEAAAAMQSGNNAINPSQEDALMSVLQRGQGGSEKQTTYNNQVELNVTIQGQQEAEDWVRNSFTRLIEESLTTFPSR